MCIRKVNKVRKGIVLLKSDTKLDIYFIFAPDLKYRLKDEATIAYRGRYFGKRKTTFTMGLLRALKKRGMRVQPFKCGPDYIDTQFHTLAADRESVNLDTWMASRTHVQHIYNKYGEGADVCVAEGVMGLFDGYSRMEGSSAEISQLLGIPVILVVSARSAAYSVAPLIYGFKHFHPNVKIAGVVFNQVSSLPHYNYLKDACADAGVECLGYLPLQMGLRFHRVIWDLH